MQTFQIMCAYRDGNVGSSCDARCMVFRVRAEDTEAAKERVKQYMTKEMKPPEFPENLRIELLVTTHLD